MECIERDDLLCMKKSDNNERCVYVRKPLLLLPFIHFLYTKQNQKKKKRMVHFFKNILKKRRSTAIRSGPSVLSKLPKELLLCIYQQLETPDCCLEFARTCRSFHNISQQPHSKAAWIITRFGARYAIHYSLLNMPHLCTRHFLLILFRLGAIIPAHLIQSLIVVYGKPVVRRRRRSSSSSPLEIDDFFSEAITKLPFDGFATLIQYAHQQHPLLQPLDGVLHWSPTTLSLREMLKNNDYRNIATVFEFDPIARTALWETVLLVLFDEAFRSHPSHHLTAIENVTQGPMVLVGPWTDQQLFCQMFSKFFTKYPVGYCQQKTMTNMLKMLKLYVKPSSFSIDLALEHMVQASLGRSDTIESVDKFLKQQQLLRQ